MRCPSCGHQSKPRLGMAWLLNHGPNREHPGEVAYVKAYIWECNNLPCTWFSAGQVFDGRYFEDPDLVPMGELMEGFLPQYRRRPEPGE